MKSSKRMALGLNRLKLIRKMSEKKEKIDTKEFFRFGEVLGYFFRRKDPSRKTNVNLKMMHGINKISILMFLVGLVYLLGKYLFQ